MSDSNKKAYFRSRREAISAIEHQIKWWRSPRLTMAGFMLIAGLVGYVVSAILLKYGVFSIPIRYAFALITGYAVLCSSLWLWTGSHPRNIAADESLVLENPIDSIARQKKQRDYGYWPSYMGIDFDEGFWIVAILVALFGIVFWLISSAPTMMAELTLDSLVSMQVLYRIRPSEKQHYLATFWRTTRFKLLVMTILVVGGAWVLQHCVPEAHTLWQVFRLSTSL